MDPWDGPGVRSAMASKKADQNADIMARLAATGLLPVMAEARKAAPRADRTKRAGSGTRNGRFVGTNGMGQYGRRVMSIYQAKALGSGRGVVVNPEKMSWTDSPQDMKTGWATSHWTSTGRNTIYGV